MIILTSMKLKCRVVSLLLLWAVGCAAPHAVDISYQPHENRAELKAMAQRLHERVNAHRAAENLPTLRFHARISSIARYHSAAMAQREVFSHNGFKGRAINIGKFMSYIAVAENLAYNYGNQDPVAKAMESWLKSEQHRKAMESPYFRVTGIAVAKSLDGKYYFTQLFVSPSR